MISTVDMRCPECGADNQLDIQALVWVRLTQDGTDAGASHDGSHQWDDDSSCRCDNCGWNGTVLNTWWDEKT